MKKVFLFNTNWGYGFYFYFDKTHLYILTTSSIYDIFMIPLNLNFDNEKLSKFKLSILDLEKYKNLLKNAEEVDYKKYFYNEFTGQSPIYNMPKYYFYYRDHFILKSYEYLKLFATLYNREEKIDNIINI